MNLKEKLSYFWNVTLGEDYQETENIQESDNPEYAELKKSLNRVQEIEEKYSKSDLKNKNKVVETVVINPKAIKKAAEINKEKEDKEIEER